MSRPDAKAPVQVRAKKSKLAPWERSAVAERAAALKTRHSPGGAMSWSPWKDRREAKGAGQLDLDAAGLVPDEATRLRQEYRNQRAAEEEHKRRRSK